MAAPPVAFRVPNERPNAGTVKIEVTLPAEYPLASVRTKPLPGWKAEVVKGKLDKPVKNHGADVTEAVRTVTWTAEPGVRIEPDQYQEFFVSGRPAAGQHRHAGPARPSRPTTTARSWTGTPRRPPTGAEEPERPAPALKLAAKDRRTTTGTATAAAANRATATTASASGSDQTARYLGGAGLAVGALGLGFGAGCGPASRGRSRPMRRALARAA